MDVIGFLIRNGRFPFTDHIEWWSQHFQYSSNVTQIFWVFNQSVPVWLLLIFMLQLKDNRYIAGISALAFAYSPWATIWMVPIALVGSFYHVKSKKTVFNVANMAVPLCMLTVFGAFYMASSGSSEKIMFITQRYPNQTVKILLIYLVFVLLEFGILFLAMGRDIWQNKYSWIIVGELLLLPLFSDTDGNTIMRGSIPALFLLMYMVCGFLMEKKAVHPCRRWIVILVLCIGMVTPFTEINRSIQLTLKYGAITQEQVYSFRSIQTDDEAYLKKIKSQFMVEDYESTFFFRYLARKDKG
jgi:TRAP-type C4-dicarboxylate transport system permease small subunit